MYDICATLAASMASPRPGAIYNVADDEPAPRHEVEAFAAGLLGLPSAAAAAAPPVDANPTAGTTSGGGGVSAAGAGTERQGKAASLQGAGPGTDKASPASGLEEKRVRNDLIKQELGVRLAFPTYREGLQAIHSGDLRPFRPGGPSRPG